MHHQAVPSSPGRGYTFLPLPGNIFIPPGASPKRKVRHLRPSYDPDRFQLAHSHRRKRPIEHILYGVDGPICGASPRAPPCREAFPAGMSDSCRGVVVYSCCNCASIMRLIVATKRLLNVGGPGAKPPAIGPGDDDASTTPNGDAP